MLQHNLTGDDLSMMQWAGGPRGRASTNCAEVLLKEAKKLQRQLIDRPLAGLPSAGKVSKSYRVGVVRWHDDASAHETSIRIVPEAALLQDN